MNLVAVERRLEEVLVRPFGISALHAETLQEFALRWAAAEVPEGQLGELEAHRAREEEHWWLKADFANQSKLLVVSNRIADPVDNHTLGEDSPEEHTLVEDTPAGHTPVGDNLVNPADYPSEAVGKAAALDLRFPRSIGDCQTAWQPDFHP